VNVAALNIGLVNSRFGQIRPSSGAQPTVVMPSVAEVDLAEFAETAASLSPQIARFFWWGELYLP
jgi:hypothetical protein